MAVSLSDVKTLLRERGTVRESDLAHHFRCSEAMIAMICEKLEEKGLVQLQTGGGGCCQAPRSWLERFVEGNSSCEGGAPCRHWRWKGPR